MKHSNRKLLAAIAGVAALLCMSSVYAGKFGASAGHAAQDRTVVVRAADLIKADSFEYQVNGDKIVGMTAVRKDGARVTLKALSEPSCVTGCPAGQHIYCWEDHEQQMSICVCHGSHDRDRMIIMAA